MDTTYDQVRRCRICDEPGELVGEKLDRKTGNTTHEFKCMNSRCRWYNTVYIADVRRDGSIAEPPAFRNKSFRAIPDRTDAVQEQMNRLYNQTLNGGEIRN